jgi:GTPase SAR1 family protein
VPRQIPPVVTDFTGRDAELQKLVDASSAGVVTFALVGMGGIGKTALAVRLAHELKSRFPDGQFYLNLRGTSPKPLLPTDAQAHVIRSLDPELALPEYPDGLAGLYRTMLDGRRTLLLMEDARDSEQVEPLIPPAGSVLILTSRRQFALPGIAF